MRRSVDRQRMTECTSDKDRPDKDLYASVCICSHYVFRLSLLLCACVCSGRCILQSACRPLLIFILFPATVGGEVKM